MSQKLLPVGFYDLLFEEAQKNHDNVNKILSEFFAKGYRLIKAPLVEFEENFSQEETANSFRLTDIISGKNLILRNDITPQISRLLSTRLEQEKLPIKLCYVGDVLYAKSEELYADRQQTQVGLEMIGIDSDEAHLEVISLLLTALNHVGINEPLIEFSLPGFLETLLTERGIKNSAELRDAVMKKNLSLIRQLSDSEIIAEIALTNDSLDSIAKKVSSIEIKKAQKISEFLQKNFPRTKVRFDLFGDHDTSYHRGIAFDIFCKNFSYPIARGGRYEINNINAVGATIYMNRLRKFS